MKSFLLFGLGCTFGCSLAHTQIVDYFPSGSTSAPTWEYYNVCNAPNGAFTNADNSIPGDVLLDGYLKAPNFNHLDAYDGAFECYVNDIFHPYSLTPEEYAQVDTVNGLFLFPSITLGNLFVRKTYYTFHDKPLIRIAIHILNPDQAASDVTVGIRSNLGSDNQTRLDTCSTGNAALSDADRWMITWDTITHGDPVLTWVRYGAGNIACTPAFEFKPENGQDTYEDKFQLTVPGNDYRLIVLFAGMDSTTASARTHVIPFNSTNFMESAGYFTGFSNADKSRIVNWNLSSIAGMEELSSTAEVTLFPNPGSGKFQLTANSAIQEVTITQTSGIEVSRIYPGASQTTLHLEEQPAGIYFLHVRTGKGEQVVKLVLR